MNEKEHHPTEGTSVPGQEQMKEDKQSENKQGIQAQPPYEPESGAPIEMGSQPSPGGTVSQPEARPIERPRRARGTAAMDPQTRKEVARKGGLAVSRNKQHMAEIGRKGGQSVSKNREHMAQIGRKGGAASRGHR